MGFTNWQERAEKAEESLRSLASFVGAGGYNADKVDADVFEEKIRWGIGEIMTRVAPVPAPAVPAPVQTAKQADCRTCANSGKVNGLSQETYCESCVHEGRNWRKNNFLDAAGQRLLEGEE